MNSSIVALWSSCGRLVWGGAQLTVQAAATRLFLTSAVALAPLAGGALASGA
jgi:hypothetical protein